jgi:hypothetical protein
MEHTLLSNASASGTAVLPRAAVSQFPCWPSCRIFRVRVYTTVTSDFRSALATTMFNCPGLRGVGEEALGALSNALLKPVTVTAVALAGPGAPCSWRQCSVPDDNR